MPTNCLKYTVIILFVIFVLMESNECFKNPVINKNTKIKLRKVNASSYVSPNNLLFKENMNNVITGNASGRGFFGSGLLALGKVLNFFPVGGERECQPSSYTAARAGICLNQYDCRQREGRAAGDCAHGLGVCCVFETSCGGSVQNNLTYFLSPGFPELWTEPRDCNITIEKTHAGITQLRIDFVHFTIGQPNRTTGECDEDVMSLGEGKNKLVLCGQNHGQHIYYTLPSGTESREADELPSTKSTLLSIRMRGSEMPRLWLMRLAQMPLAHSAPHDCLQYHTSDNGTIQTFNFAINGRHIAGQEYRACIRKNSERCAVRYTPCDNRSFRIGPNQDTPAVIDPAGSMQQAPMMPANDIMQEEEGSGADPQATPVIESPAPSLSLAARIWRFIWPSWLWGQRSVGRGWSRWSPYKQHYVQEEDELRYYGYGNFGATLSRYGRKRCTDRITIPCENEYFISSTSYIPGVCDPHHCGSTLCAGVDNAECRVETSISPFAVSVHFGPPTPKRSPEENIGACLRYTQLPCDT